MTLTPAYGRDYKSKSAFEADLNAGKDFLGEEFDWPRPRPINEAQLLGEGIRRVQIRYKRLTKTAEIEVTE